MERWSGSVQVDAKGTEAAVPADGSRCCVCLPASQPCTQRTLPSDARHPPTPQGTRVQEACPTAAPTGGLDQG